jgi:hypothetical protein
VCYAEVLPFHDASDIDLEPGLCLRGECQSIEQGRPASPEADTGATPAGRPVCSPRRQDAARHGLPGKSSGVHLLALYLASEGLVLAQLQIRSKANEISAAPRLLKMVSLQGMVVTGDAMFTQRNLSIQIVKVGGDYIWDIKKNQLNLLRSTQELFDGLKCTYMRCVGIGH